MDKHTEERHFCLLLLVFHIDKRCFVSLIKRFFLSGGYEAIYITTG